MRRSDLFDALVVVLVASAPIAIEQLRGLVHAGGDLSLMFIPHYAWWWSAPRWLGGWNQWIFGGFPSNADPLVGHVHPFGLFWAALPPIAASAVEGAAAPTMAGLGMLVYLRSVGCGRTGSVLGAIAFAAGGWVHAHAMHPEKLRSVLAIPWALAAVERLRGPRLLAGLGIAVAVIVAGGHPQTIALSVLLVGTYALVFTSSRRGWIVGAFAAGVAVPAVTWLPAIELVGRSVHVDTQLAGGSYFGAACAHTIVVPFGCGGGGSFYGTSIDRFPGCGIVDCTSYPGMLVLLLVLAGAGRLAVSSRGPFWLAVAALGVVLSTGALETVVHIPGLRAPSRALLWVDIALCVGAAMVANAIGREGGTPRSFWTAVLVLLAVVAFASTRGSIGWRASLGSLAVLVAAALAGRRPSHAALVAVLSVDLVLFGAEFHVGEPKPAIPSELRDVRGLLEYDGGSAGPWGRAIGVPGIRKAMWSQVEHVRTLQGWNVLAPAAYMRLLAGEAPSPLGYDFAAVSDLGLLGPDSHVLDLLRARMIVVNAGSLPASALRRPRWRPAGGSVPWHIYANERARPVAWLVHQCRVVPDDEALRVVRGEAGPFEPATEALVSRPILVEEATAPERVEVVAYEDDRIVLRADASAAALLVTSELASPGWTAALDGRDVAVHTVNAGFRAVMMPAGTHDVVFRYRPWQGKAGIGIGIAGLLVIIACAGARTRLVDSPLGL